MKIFLPTLRFLLAAGFGLMTAGILAVAGLYLYMVPDLPSIDELKDVRFQVPLRVYTADRQLIAEFGEKRRQPIRYEGLPPVMVQAFLAAEDDRFFEHPGVDYQGLLRAAIELARTGEKRQGGSTITMQVARNFFLTTEKTYLRKIKEIFLALKIERSLSKEEILELYLNKIYLGHRSYGVGAAAQVYYGTSIEGLTLPQVAMIAGLPKAPSRDNPITNPDRALIRRNYVLSRLEDLGQISEQTYQAAKATPDDARIHAQPSEVEAPYAAEMVRAEMVARFGSDAYTNGYRVITTLDSTRQAAANRALRNALIAYDRRHGYRGPEAQLALPQDLPAEEAESALAGLLKDFSPSGGLFPALVLALEAQTARVYSPDLGDRTIAWEGLSWARAYRGTNRRGPEPEQADEILAPGDVIRIQLQEDGTAHLAQIPDIEGALVSLLPGDGAIAALAGGFDFYRSKFNRVIQGQRQPGSSFKPFIYSAALEHGFTAASIINDAPVVFDDPSLETTWRPENYSGKFYGPTRLREALVRSRNLVSVRLLRSINPRYAIEYAQRFGFEPRNLPKDLSLALGSGSATPLDMARAYAVFANGGYRVEPYLITRITDATDEPLFEATPLTVCETCEETEGETAPPEAVAVAVEVEVETDAGDPGSESGEEPGVAGIELSPGERNPAQRVITPENAYLMTTMMRDVIRRGTGRRAMSLGRTDLAGKTGTTNDQRDAWFCGFNGELVTTAWVGFDQVEPLGTGETGGRAALPMWMEYMGAALQGRPTRFPREPEGLVTVRIDPETGLLASPGQAGSLFETFRPEQVPTEMRKETPTTEFDDPGSDAGEPLF